MSHDDIDFADKLELQKAKLFFDALLEAERRIPWALKTGCLSDDLITYFVSGKIPEDEKGNILKDKILDHFITCEKCRKRDREIAATYIQTFVLPGAGQAEQLFAFIKSLAILTALYEKRKMARQVAMRGHKQRSFRSSQDELIGYVVDKHENLILNDDGEPQKIKFTAFEKRIDKNGRIRLKLNTNDKTYWEKRNNTYQVYAAIQYAGKKITLPSSIRSNKIFSTGDVTITGSLGFALESGLGNIPSEAIKLTIKKVI